LILVALGCGGPLGTLAALLQMLNHSLVKSMMFLLSGNIMMKYRSRSLDLVQGLMQAAPVTSVLLLGGIFALVGAPPFNIFLSKFMIISAGIASGHLWLMLVCLLFLIVAFVALFKMLSSVVFGTKPENVTRGETGITTLAPILILMAFILVLGVTMPAPLAALLQGASQVVTTGTTTAQSSGVVLAPHGILGLISSPPSQSFIALFGVQPGN
jgi:hydrogenase-4 component F